MNAKKIISIICLLTVLFTVVGMPAAATQAQSEEYLIINDQFGDGDFCDWEIKEYKTTTTPLYSVSTEEIAGDAGNYALKYVSGDRAEKSWAFNYLSRSLDVPVDFAPDTDVVIEARIKTAGTGRMFFKYNMDGTSYYENEWQHGWGLLVQNETGDVSMINGWKPNAQGLYGYPVNFTGTGTNRSVVTDATGDWYTYKITIHCGETKDNKTADHTIYAADGTVLATRTGFNIDFPDNSNWINVTADGATGASWVEDILKSVDVRIRMAETVWIDYVKVWQTGVVISDAQPRVDMNSVKVKLTSNAAVATDLSDCFDVYTSDGATLIEASKSFDGATGTITLTPEQAFIMGEYYTVKADAAAIAEKHLYTYNAPTEIQIQAPSCVAENLSISGELIPGDKLTAVYDIKPEAAVESGSVIKWYSVSGDDYTEIGSGAEYTVEDADVDLTVTYSVIPKVLLEGEEKTGDEIICEEYVTPLSAPVAENPGYDKSNAIIDLPLSAVYDYSDADGDEESGSEIIWYKGTAPDSNDYTEIGRGKTITVTSDLKNYYLMYTVAPKSNAAFRDEGAVTESTPIGPVGDILSVSNLVVNGDFETGNTDPWVLGGLWSATPGAMTIYSEDKYEGNYCLKLIATPNPSASWSQVVSGATSGKTYLVSFMAKAVAEEVPYEAYSWGGTDERPYRVSEVVNLSTSEWKRCTLTTVSTSSTIRPAGARYGTDGNDAVMIDNFYFGELMIKDIETNEPEPVNIPETGEEYVEITKGEIINQLGTTNGLVDEEVVLTVTEGKGVYTNGNNLIVTSKAVAGDVKIKVACTPSSIIPGVAPFEKYVTVTLLPNSKISPEAANVNISGIVKNGEALTLTYDYYQVEGKEDASTYRWMWADSANGAYTQIPGATGTSYTVESEYADKFIKCVVSPAAVGGLTSGEVSSNVLVKNTAPSASEVMVSGEWYIDGKVTGSYVYTDINNDEESGTLYRWLMSDTEDGVYTDIEGQTSKELILTSDMQDKYIKFAVTPKNNAELGTGAEVMSQPYLGPAVPQVKDVKTSKNGATYIATYTYYHPHNLKEEGTVYGWYNNDVLVSSGVKYVPDFEGTRVLTFKITPSCEKAPHKGESYSCTVTVVGSGSSSATGAGGFVAGGGFAGGGSVSSGGSGGSGGASNSGFQSGVTNINNMDYVVPVEKEEEEQKPASDIENHWGKTYIDDMVSRGVMSANDEGNYEPDMLISRGDMITFLFKALKLEESEYTGGFSDVSSEDAFSGYLQTMLNNGTIAEDESFRPGDNISREEMCKILYISLENAGKLEKAEEAKAEVFADYSSVSEWARDYVNTIFSYGIMIGVSDERFAPQESVTKAQVATMLVRILSHIEEAE